jgi:NADH dehydrogenase
MRGMILVTGGTGFVGGHVVAALRRAGKEVRCLVRDVRGARRPGLAGCELVRGDMTDPSSLGAAVDGVDAVVHLVAIRQGKEEQFERIMSRGTRDLVAAAEDAGVHRFVLMSALGVSEQTRDLVPYYRAKWEMEDAVRGSSLPFVIFRPSFVFGVDGGILPTFRKLAKLAPITPIPGSGDQRIQPIWADDVAAYFVAAVDDDVPAGTTFELGGPDVVTWNELWARLKQALGTRRPSIHLPMAFMRANALVTERLPGNIPLTRDLLKMMEAGDNVVSDDAAARTFGLSLVPLDEQLRRVA